MVKWVAMAVVLAAVMVFVFAMKAKPEPPKKPDATTVVSRSSLPTLVEPDPCQRLAASMGMNIPKEAPRVRQAIDGQVVHQYGEVACFVSGDQVRSLQDMSNAARAKGGKPRLANSNQLAGFAGDLLKKNGFTKSWPVKMMPEGDFAADVVEVFYRAEQDSHGYPTNGFAGLYEVSINRYTGQTISFRLSPERKIEKPEIKMTESEARSKAMQVFSQEGIDASGAEVRAHLQYLSPKGSNATDAGRRAAQEGRLPMVWQVSLWMPSKFRPQTMNPGKFVVIDAETGEVLMK